MARTSLPPGFRFHPTDVELVMYYLKRKIMGKRLHFEAIAEVNIYKFSPWDLKDKSILKSRDLEWFFFCPREKKYACGVRMKRATENGYWKTTGKDRPVRYNENVVGMVRTLVFHLGHAPQGRRTNWVIHEYRILDEQLSAAGLQDLYVLCKVFEKNGPGPKNGAQYGAPFNEADWDDDDDVQTHVKSLPSGGPSSTALTLPENQCCSVITSMVNPGSTPGPSLIEAGPSHFSGPAFSGVPLDLDLDDEVLRWLATFTDDSVLLDDNGNHENRDDHNQKGKNKCLPCLDGNDIYNGLCDLDSWGSMNEGGLNFAGMQKDGYLQNYTLPQNDIAYLELNDLEVPLNHPAEVNETEQMQFDNFGVCSNFAGMQKDGYLQNYTLPQNDTAYLELNDLEVPLNHPAEVNETEQMQFDNFGLCSQGNTEQLIFGGNFSDMDLYASCQGHLPVPPEGSKQPGSCSDVLQAESSNRDGRNNEAAYSLDFTGGHSEDGGTPCETWAELVLMMSSDTFGVTYFFGNYGGPN